MKIKILIIISSLIALVTGAIYGGPILLEKGKQKSQEYQEAGMNELKEYVAEKVKEKKEDRIKMWEKIHAEDKKYCKEHENDRYRSKFRCHGMDTPEERELKAQKAKEDQEKWSKKWAEDREKTFGDAAREERDKAIGERADKLMKNKNH